LLFPGSVTDIDDLILNTAGAAIGYGIYKLVSDTSHLKKWQECPK
jgi:glycopeptide antibiotics resistance protein